MDYDVSEISGTDDDLPPSHQNRIPRGGKVSGNERSAVGSISFSRMYTEMEAEIHHLEQEAYCAVLRAFKAQSNAITWEKEGLITELRKELRVSDDEHRELLTRVNSEDIIDKIRVWRDKGGHQAARLTSSQNVNVYELLSSPTISASRKKQKTSQSGRHALVYDIHTPNETWEWVDLKEISPEDICWEDPGPSGRRAKKSTSHTTRKRGPTKFQSKKELTSQNGIGKNGIGKAPDDLELLNTDTLVKEVERIFNASEPDPFELEKARKILKDHEQALVDAIQRLAYASDGESDREHTFLHSRSMDG